MGSASVTAESLAAEKAAAEKAARKAAARSFRAAQRAKGLRLVKIWVPDTRLPEVAAKIRRDCEALKDDPHEREVMDWLDQVRDTTGWV